MMLSSKVIVAEKTEESSFTFKPPALNVQLDESLIEENCEDLKTAFVLDQTQKEIAGIDKANQQKFDEILKHEVLLQVQAIQEQAYKEGFELGREEGRTHAIAEAVENLNPEIENFQELIISLSHQYADLAKKNEARLIELIFLIGSRLAAKNLEINPDLMVQVVRETVGSVSSNDKVVLELNPSLLQFFEEIQKSSKREFEFLKSVQIEPNESIQAGGCLVRTEYGQIDAQLETRIQNLWSQMQSALPQVG